MDPQAPLRGTRVLEFGTFITGSYAAGILGDMGADVVKVERPPGGDPMRGWGEDDRSPYFRAYNKSKRSVLLDLRASRGLEACRRLIESSDVLVHNYRPSVADRLGIGVEAVHEISPTLVYCQISGFGEAGPYSARPSYNQVVQSISGLDSLIVDAEDPAPVGPNFGDTVTALYAVQGILAALVRRERDGVGAVVDTTMLASMTAFLSADVQDLLATGSPPTPHSRPRFSQSYMVRTGDGRALTIHLSSPPKFWEGLLRAIERPDLAEHPAFATWSDRVREYDKLHAELAPEFTRLSRSEWIARLEQEDVPVAPVLDLKEALDDVQAQTMNLVAPLPVSSGGTEPGVRYPVIIDGEQLVGTAAPGLGEHSAQILGALGYADVEIAEITGAKAAVGGDGA
jgi:crotonobetainyl-CoA:carnitine CoA-transferase CaiB-like acyl-CoA transferase